MSFLAPSEDKNVSASTTLFHSFQGESSHIYMSVYATEASVFNVITVKNCINGTPASKQQCHFLTHCLSLIVCHHHKLCVSAFSGYTQKLTGCLQATLSFHSTVVIENAHPEAQSLPTGSTNMSRNV